MTPSSFFFGSPMPSQPSDTSPDLLRTISRLLGETIPHRYASLSLWDEAAQGLRRWAVAQPDVASIITEGELLNGDEPPWLAFESGDVIEIRKQAFDGLHTKVTTALVDRGRASGPVPAVEDATRHLRGSERGQSQPGCVPAVRDRAAAGGSPGSWRCRSRMPPTSIAWNDTDARPVTSATASSCCSTSTMPWSRNWTRTRCGRPCSTRFDARSTTTMRAS